ncbi:MAG: Grx4 family monothiol glutaredoxin [Acidobacteriota bacterium]
MGLTDMFFGKKQEGDESSKRIPVSAAPAPRAYEPRPEPTEAEMLATIKDTIANNKIAVFMKGTPAQPMCGFSAAVVDILGQMNVPFAGVNAIEHPRFRQILSAHTNWPTLPQVFVGGKLIGGCDIVREMKASGELDKVVAEALK